MIGQDVMLAAELAMISWISTSMLAAEWGRHASRVDARPVPDDLVTLAQPPK
jgi:hypothetical protein